MRDWLSDRVICAKAARAAWNELASFWALRQIELVWLITVKIKPIRTMSTQSDLHFIVDAPQGTDFGQGNAIFFQAPAGRTDNPGTYGGLPGMLNAMGYYVTYGKETSGPAYLADFERNRFRLMQFQTPAEAVSVQATNDSSWYANNLSSYSEVLAENVILLLCWPRLSMEEDPEGDDLTTSYRYDSRLDAAMVPQPVTAHQQPPMVHLTMVVIDRKDADRLADTATPPAEITGALAGLFTQSTETNYRQDLATLEQRLETAGISYRIFGRTVPLREAKWTKQ